MSPRVLGDMIPSLRNASATNKHLRPLSIVHLSMKVLLVRAVRGLATGPLRTAVLVIALSLQVPCSIATEAPVFDHPLLSRPKGADASKPSYKRLDMANVIQNSTHSEEPSIISVPVEGEVHKIDYRLEKSMSLFEARKSYQNALAELGLVKVFDCSPIPKCGENAELVIRESGIVADKSLDLGAASSFLMSYAGLINGADTYIVLVGLRSPAFERIFQQVVVSKDQFRQVSTSAALNVSEIEKGFATQGFATLSGIYFDYDKALLKAESRVALENVASLLSTEPRLSLYVVGHTDDSGSYEHNLKLSQDRAEAVRNYLVKGLKVSADRVARFLAASPQTTVYALGHTDGPGDYAYNRKLSEARTAAVRDYLSRNFQIDPSRIESQGVGSLAPVASNRSEQGRAENRRVMLVEKV